MKINATNAENTLWDEMCAHGCRCYIEGTAFPSNRPFPNLARVLGVGTSPELSRMMRMSGISETYITGGASDYDKLEALCRVLHLWVGHPLVMAIREILRRVFDISEPLSVESLPGIWQRTAADLFETDLTPAGLLKLWGVGSVVPILSDGESAASLQAAFKNCVPYLYLSDLLEGLWCGADAPRLSPKMPTEDMTAHIDRLADACVQKGYGGIWVDLSALDAFRRPDPYRPARGVLRLQSDPRSVEMEDRRLIMTQTLRLLGGACVKRQLRMTLVNTSDEVLEPACRYLEGCGCLPRTDVALSSPCDALLWGVSPLLAVPDHALSADFDHLLSDFAVNMPLGMLVGVYRPVREPLDLPLWEETGRALCRYVEGMGALGWGPEAHDAQTEILGKIFT